MTRQFDMDRGNSRVVFGSSALGMLGDVLAELGARRALLVCSERGRSLAEATSGQIGGIGVGIFDGSRQHVPEEVVREASSLATSREADWVIAIGGGSAIGLAKAIALEHSVSVAAVPTTYSGSEMTPIWGVTSEGVKSTGRSERARPRLVIYDPTLTASLPRSVAIPSLFNAMAHAIEALYAPKVDPMTMSMAEQAIELVGSAVERLASSDADREVTDDALYGSHLAGACLNAAAMGLHHKLCHVLGGSFGLPHAATHTVILPHVVRYNAAAAGGAIARVARALGVEDAAAGIFDLEQRAHAPTDLASLGFFSESVERAAELATAAPYPNPRPVETGAIAALLRDAIDGLRPATLGHTHARADWRRHLCGYGSVMQSEALPGALPTGQNSPRQVPYGLYAEQLNATGFTSRRALSRRTWLYRIRPSVLQSDFEPVPEARIRGSFSDCRPAPNLLRWRPLAIPPVGEKVDFVDGLVTFGGCGDPDSKSGFAIHWYTANASMSDRCLYDADGELLIAPELGQLRIRTELGVLSVAPGEIALVGRGMKFSVELADDAARGFVLEVYNGPLRLPERGPIGANGLADERHFMAPAASYEDRECPDGYEVFAKHGGVLHRATATHSPYDVVAWHGNHAAYKYDLANFNAAGSVSFDHMDPSIFTVLTSPLDQTGNTVDVVLFPPRWDVAEHSLRPPYYHRNAASEFNVVLQNRGGSSSGFEKGVYFLSPQMTAHGISASRYEAELAQPDELADRPERIDGSLWLMFESALSIRLTEWALDAGNLDHDYREIWTGLRSHFDPRRR